MPWSSCKGQLAFVPLLVVPSNVRDKGDGRTPRRLFLLDARRGEKPQTLLGYRPTERRLIRRRGLWLRGVFVAFRIAPRRRQRAPVIVRKGRAKRPSEAIT